MAFSSQPLHQTRSKSRCRASRCSPAVGERRCGAPSTCSQVPGGRSSEPNPNSESTPSMSMRSSGLQGFCIVSDKYWYPNHAERGTLTYRGSVNHHGTHADDREGRRHGYRDRSSTSLRMTLQIGILLALLSAAAANLAFFYKHRGACAAMKVDLRHPLRTAAALWRSKWFAIGMLVGCVGLGPARRRDVARPAVRRPGRRRRRRRDDRRDGGSRLRPARRTPSVVGHRPHRSGPRAARHHDARLGRRALLLLGRRDGLLRGRAARRRRPAGRRPARRRRQGRAPRHRARRGRGHPLRRLQRRRQGARRARWATPASSAC